MISRFTKFQLIAFAIITVIGGAFVGSKYAELDRLFVDRAFPVTATFSDSGGMFAGSQVTYRGVEVGEVSKLEFQPDGNLEATFLIENDAPRISADVLAVVANKSAIGEQFVDLQPQGNQAPYLKQGSTIGLDRTRIPIDTAKLLIDVNNLVQSVDTDSLQTVVSELGQAFEGTGNDLSTILDTSNEFITTAEDNLPVTRALINDSASVLQTQIDTQSALSTYSENLALLSDTLVDADPDLRRLLDEGTGSARTLRTVVDENARDLTVTLNNLVTVNSALNENILGLRGIFTLYPYLMQGSFSVLKPTDETAAPQDVEWDATFGLVLNGTPPCTFSGDKEASGYRARRAPDNLSDDFLDNGQQFEFPNPANIDCDLPDDENPVIRRPDTVEFNRVEPASTAKTGDDLADLLLAPVTQ